MKKVDGKVYCLRCGYSPCKWMEVENEVLMKVRNKFGDEVIINAETGLYVRVHQPSLDSDDDFLRSRQKRFALYKQCVKQLYGNLGKGTRVQLPFCVETNIKSMYPANKYVGFFDADADNNHEVE